MATFLVIRTQDGPDWDPAKPMEEQTRRREHADSMDELTAAVRRLGGRRSHVLTRDPWHESPVVRSIETLS